MQGVGEPQLIIEGASSPHAFSLKPSQAAMLQQAELVIWMGDQLEVFLEKPVKSLAEKAVSLELIEAEGVNRLPLREGGAFDEHGDDAAHGGTQKAGEAHAGHDHRAFDAHAWLDPQNAKAFVRAIAGELVRLDPANATHYHANAIAAGSEIDALSAQIEAQLAPVKSRPFIVFHDACQYFEARFGLQSAGSITMSPEVMPGAERIARLRQTIAETGAACVFAEPQFEPKLVSVVVEGSAAKTGVLDPLGSAIAAGPDHYPALLRALAQAMASCLAPD
jgi:zinc transport system substrate-binding protein